jgi:hypothetical protein
MMAARSSENANRNLAETKELNRFKALVEFLKTHDILLLQRRLGHKHLGTTYAYLDRSRPLIKSGEHTNLEEV